MVKKRVKPGNKRSRTLVFGIEAEVDEGRWLSAAPVADGAGEAEASIVGKRQQGEGLNVVLCITLSVMW